MEDAAAIYTLNLVDRTLLCDDEHGEIALAAEGDPEPDPEPFVPVDGTETVLAEDAQTSCTAAADAAVLAEIVTRPWLSDDAWPLSRQTQKRAMHRVHYNTQPTCPPQAQCGTHWRLTSGPIWKQAHHASTEEVRLPPV